MIVVFIACQLAEKKKAMKYNRSNEKLPRPDTHIGCLKNAALKKVLAAASDFII
jgi:hypothetical protein